MVTLSQSATLSKAAQAEPQASQTEPASRVGQPSQGQGSHPMAT